METEEVLYEELCGLLIAFEFEAGDEWNDSSLCEAFYSFGKKLKSHWESTLPLTNEG